MFWRLGAKADAIRYLLIASLVLYRKMRSADWNAAGLSPTSDIPLPDWTPELSLAYMDKFDIAGAILSLSSPGLPFGDLAKASSMARQVRSNKPCMSTS